MQEEIKQQKVSTDNKDFRLRGIIILSIGLILSLVFGFILNSNILYVLSAISAILLIRRLLVKKQQDNYIFGEKLGGQMQKVPVTFILEAQMMALFFLILGVAATGIYLILFQEFTLIFKIIVGSNSFFGVVLLTAALLTAFQQYKSIKTMMDVQELMKGGAGYVG